MPKLTITVSEDVAARLRERAIEAGLEGPEAYLENVVVDEILEEDEALKQELIRRIESNDYVEMTPESFRQMTAGILARVNANAGSRP